MTKEIKLTPQETAAFQNLKNQEVQKHKELLAVQGAIQGAIIMVTSQHEALSAEGEFNHGYTKLTVTIADPDSK